MFHAKNGAVGYAVRKHNDRFRIQALFSHERCNEGHAPEKQFVYVESLWCRAQRGRNQFDTAKTVSFAIDRHDPEHTLFRPEDAWIEIEYEVNMPSITAKMFYDFYRNDDEGRRTRTSLHDYL